MAKDGDGQRPNGAAYSMDFGEWGNGFLLPQVIVSDILRIPPPMSRRLDRLVWDLNSSGSFTVSSTYQVVRLPGPRSFLLANIWHLLIPAKVSFFMLRLLESSLPVMDILYRFQVQGPSHCWCYNDPKTESLDHIFCTGEIPLQVWQSFEGIDGSLSPVFTVRHALTKWWLRVTTKSALKLIYRILPCLVCWHLWRATNSVLFEGKGVTAAGVHLRILGELREILCGWFFNLAIGGLFWYSLLDLVVKKDRLSRISWQNWSRSQFRIPKLNVDGCYRDNP
ncbi:uncharacterized protein [Coffea arabica]|uniref:Reverse transcriptase zinc-binding domain-containing protein n=1 Tax=Coffea arabica TaxID=13443 RepID=A0ABM4VGS5_COFAR